MLSDADIQVLLNLSTMPGQVIIAPTVRAAVSGKIDYTIIIHKSGPGGISSISQSAQTQMIAGEALALSKTVLGMGPEDACKLKMHIKEGEIELFRNDYDCTPPK